MAIRVREDGRRRVAIEQVGPAVDAGRFAAKRSLGEPLAIEAAVFADGHDLCAAAAQYRRQGEDAWHEQRMETVAQDRFRARIDPLPLGLHEFRVLGWIDHFATWQRDLTKKFDAGQDVAVDLLAGVELARAATADGEPARRIHALADALADDALPVQERVAFGTGIELAELMRVHGGRPFVTVSAVHPVLIDPPLAATGAWYELFPRSTAPIAGRHGTFRDVQARLPYVASMGFDVLYLPPIHPIGRVARKGPNNMTTSAPGDPGSPWAIGAEEGGHDAIHPELGTFEEFRQLVHQAAEHGLALALDVAFQCAPDHPWVEEHPEWFRKRPDGTIQYAENPPKQYQDIYPFDFETPAWESLWQALLDVFLFWIGEGVKVFRVDNPHTKALSFWEWCLTEIHRRHPEVIFLSEAFTRPRLMYRLAKAGFNQSYTYFAWKNTSHDLRRYVEEITAEPVRQFFRPNFWPNTPDILNEYLQFGGPPAFQIRLVLAATLSSSYGIYGPAFELCEHVPRDSGSEEYLDSEKYEIRAWDLDRPDSLRELITRVNRCRRANPALLANRNLTFHDTDNEFLLCYSKSTDDGLSQVLVVVNLDPRHTHTGFLDLDLAVLGVDRDRPFQVHDQISDARFLWQGAKNFVELNPHVLPAHVFRVRRRVRTERDFEYFA